ncbi:two-component sensor histidine kinase [Tolypothrix sp. NIES-4075]|uniref:hypothetical protein n=1 Tax=Tolypothrix sp. NIES-4075 TaxID=2005459 RepID=UPI000B6E8E1C|nr:hypothetical protein [Tolypothrix sp. NIES-4075]GAX42085.1 two-component sensor histidine kinase [Tolypothrix sp. NIES-4075]
MKIDYIIFKIIKKGYKILRYRCIQEQSNLKRHSISAINYVRFFDNSGRLIAIAFIE